MTQAIQTIQTNAMKQGTMDRFLGNRFRVIWSSLLPPPSAREGGDQGMAVHANGHARTATFTIALEILEESRGVLTSQVEQPGHELHVISNQAVDLEIHCDGDLRQIRATMDGQPRFLLVLDSEDRLVYVQSPLPEEGGVLGGRFDPPTLQIFPAGN